MEILLKKDLIGMKVTLKKEHPKYLKNKGMQIPVVGENGVIVKGLHGTKYGGRGGCGRCLVVDVKWDSGAVWEKRVDELTWPQKNSLVWP